MYGCKSWSIKKAEHQRTDVFVLWCWRRLLSPLDCKEIKPVNPKGNQLWTFIGRTDAKAEARILWPPDAKRQLTGKDPDAGKDWGQEVNGGGSGWHGWMASLTQWTLVWAGFRSWWWTGKPGVLQSMGSQRIRHDWATRKAFDCVDHNKLENSEWDGNTRPADLPLEKPICRSGSKS